MSYLGVIFSFVFINNVVISKMLGLPDTGESRESRFDALGVLLLFTLSAVSALAGWGLWTLTRKADFVFLPSFCLYFLLICLAIEYLIRRSRPKISNALSMEMRRVETSGVAFGLGTLIGQTQGNLLKAGLASVAAVCGYLAANCIFRKIMERLELSRVPGPFRGAPIMLINASLVSLAFMAMDLALMRNFVP